MSEDLVFDPDAGAGSGTPSAPPPPPTPSGNVRVFGNGYTSLFFSFNGTTHRVAYCQQLSHTSPAPVVEPQVIQAMNHLHPIELVSPRAVGHGTITVNVMQLWNQPAWDHFAGFGGANSLQSILTRVANSANIFLQTQIISPGKNNNYSITYHDCVVADVRDDEQIDVTTMNLSKVVTFWYRWNDFNGRRTTDDILIKPGT